MHCCCHRSSLHVCVHSSAVSVFWPYDRGKLQDFLSHLNNRQESIKFTMEEENAGSIPFLDVLVKRSGNHLTTSVYRKRTHTNRYLHFSSYHHPRVKVGIISCLRDRAERICNEESIKEEKNHLQEVFEANSYPPKLVQHSLSKRSGKLKGSVQQDDEEDENNPVLCLPYVQGLSEKIEKQTKDINIRTVFTAKHTLRSCLMKVKTPRNSLDHKGVVYSIPCECGKEYIGETGRTLTQRMSEHKRAVKNGDSNNALAVHVKQSGHNIQWEEANILIREGHWTKRKIKEGIAIKKNNLNLDKGFQIDNNWFTLTMPHT